MFGDDVTKHSVVVVTHAMTQSSKLQPKSTLMTRDLILEQVDKLPPEHFMRQLVKDVDYRVIGVENRLEPYRSTSQLLLNQAVLDVVEANDGNRYDANRFLEGVYKLQENNQGWHDNAKQPDPSLSPTCSYEVEQTSKKSILKIECNNSSKIPLLLAALGKEYEKRTTR